MKLANISYLNTVPYFHFMSKRWMARHQISKSNPRSLGELARRGEVDAGVFSLMDAWELVNSGEFEYLGNLGIAGRGIIQSIMLFGVSEPSMLEGKAIAVTSHTATTSRLMEIWLKQKVGVKHWTRVGTDEKAAATLLIGDDALRRGQAKIPGDPKPIDLCQEWLDWTGLPFVFARWAVRKSLPEPEKRELLLSLTAGLELSLDDLESVAEVQSQNLGFEPAFIEAYLRGITYRLGIDEEKGMALFKEKLDQL